MSAVIKAENISKQYRLGEIGTGALSHDINRFWHKVRGKEDPYLKIGEINDRTTKGNSEYVWSLQDINFNIQQGDAVGIIGRNGAGKSTLLKILSRVTAPTTGNIRVKGRIASLLEVGTGFHPDLSGRDNIFLNGAILGMRKKEISTKFDEIVDFAGVERYIDTPVKRYSSGMYVRLAFAVAAHLESEILIVDEVLAVGDAEFQKKCLGKMNDVSKGEGRTILFVSHNMAAIQNLCNLGIILKDGKLYEQGNIQNILPSYYGLLANNPANKNKLLSYNNHNIEINRFEITNFYQSQGIVNFDKPLMVNIQGFAKRKIKDVSFGISLSTIDNISVFTTRLNDSSQNVELEGFFDLVVTINHSLRAGNYIMLLGIDSQIENFYFNPNIADLEIIDVGNEEYKIKNYGITNVKSVWEIKAK